MRKLLERFLLFINVPDEELALWLSHILFWTIVILFFVRVSEGAGDANKADRCRVESLSDVLASPAYAIGCNLSKKRFDIKLN